MTNGKQLQYAEVVESDKFKALMASKKRFIIPMTVFFLVFYFALPIMTSYFTFLNKPAVGAISWAWVYAFAQFIMTWVLCILYSRKSREFDRMVAEVRQEMGES